MQIGKRSRLVTSLVAVAAVVATTGAIVAATAREVPQIGLAAVGHWVYNVSLSALFHVDGATGQIDARTGAFDTDSGTHVAVSSDTAVAAADGKRVTTIGKSSLTVLDTTETGLGELPITLETPGRGYLVYPGNGLIYQIGVSPRTIRAGGPVSSPIATVDGTVWLIRVDTGTFCRLTPADTEIDCALKVPAGRQGALTVVAGKASFLDTVSGALHLLDVDGLGPAIQVGLASAKAKVSAGDTAGVLAAVDPDRAELVLADVSGVSNGQSGKQPTRVKLGPGRFGTPVAAERAVVVVDEANAKLLTFDLSGAKVSAVELPGKGGAAKVTRGQDGRVYVDDHTGAHTLIVAADGTVRPVAVGTTPVPAEDEKPPPVAPKPQPPKPQPAPVAPAPAKAAAPGAPSPVTAQPGDSAITASWGAAPANGSAVNGYQLTWRSVSGAVGGGTAAVSGRQLTHPITGLVNGEAYIVTVTARNAVGTGPGADSPPATPSRDVPSPPASVQAAAAPDGTVAVNWPAARGEGHAITRYDVSATGADGSTSVVAQSTGTAARVDSGLTMGTAYTFTVTATNDLGLVSAASPASPGVSPFEPAGAPGSVQARGTDATVTVTWAAPELGGGDLVGYEVTGTGQTKQTTTVRTAAFTGLTNGQTYQFTVRAVTREKGKPAGPTANGAAATASGTPGRPPVVDVTSATANGQNQATVRVAVNTNNSGPVTCHIVFNGAERWAGACGSGDIAVGGLAAGTTYDVYAWGANSYGDGQAGAHATVRTADPPPPPVITVSKGANATTAPGAGNCVSSPPCARVHVSLRNFAANAAISVSCRDSGGQFWVYSMRTDGAGNGDSEVCIYGFPGQAVWAVAAGRESNHFVW